MRWGDGVAVVAVTLGIAACSLTRPMTPPIVGGHQEGVASWYGPGFHGRRTANGEIYDQYELTAAHQTLPLGTRIMVTSQTNGRSVEVRVNDRGPFVGGRIVDLSYAAAHVLGMVGPGTMPVRIEVLDAPVEVASRSTTWARRRRETARAPAPRTRPMEGAPEPSLVVATADQSALGAYTVLVATLSDAARAEHLRSRIALKFDDAHVSPLDVGADRYYRVRIGPYPNRSVALARAALVNRYGYPAVITDEAHP